MADNQPVVFLRPNVRFQAITKNARMSDMWAKADQGSVSETS